MLRRRLPCEEMTKIAGWCKEWTKRFGEMTEEQEEGFMERICRKLRAEVGVGTEQMTEELRGYVSEQMRIAEDRRRNEKRDEETWRRATRDEQKTTSTSCDVANEAAGDDRGS